MRWSVAGKFLTALLVAAVLVIALVVALLLRRGLSSREEPTLVEEAIARAIRHLSTPLAMRNARNPVPLNAETLADARAHWADHCAGCHGNDGSGQTEIGRNLYPKAPDMRRRRTQNLTDGELFSIIRNGVRLSGMPAWGEAAGQNDADSWKLVHFIRHLPKITPQELEEMKSMNPASPMEREEEKSEQQFLEGGHPPAHHH